MPWCPKCKNEYEDEFKVCSECQVELVENLEEIDEYKVLVILPMAEVEKAVEYLKYSDVTDVKVNEVKVSEVKTDCEILVKKDEFADALKYFKIYAKESFVRDDEEFCILEYESQDIDEGDKAEEAKSTAYSFTVVGGIITIFALLNLVGVLSILLQSFYSIVFLVAGLLLTGIGIQSFAKLKDYKEEENSASVAIDDILNEYNDKHSIDSFFEDNEINRDSFDEGSLYFAVIDVIKKHLKGDYPEQGEKLLNTVAEKIYSQIIEE